LSYPTVDQSYGEDLSVVETGGTDVVVGIEDGSITEDLDGTSEGEIVIAESEGIIVGGKRVALPLGCKRKE
jgi:hypothetical protein